MLVSNDAAPVVNKNDGTMSTICTKHPYKYNRNNNPGGICPFCLQDKLGILVSSSLPITTFPSSANFTSNSFRSESTYNAVAAEGSDIDGGRFCSSESKLRKPRIPFLLYCRKKEDKGSVGLKRSKSTATPSRKFLVDGRDNRCEDQRKKRFWSFWYHSKKGSSKSIKQNGSVLPLHRGNAGGIVAGEDDDNKSVGRKVSRSRSVGCGSTSFSSDFLERISTGLGECRLRRVQSQREGGNKAKVADSCMKSNVRCGGIFGGFMVSSSPTSSSTHWLASSGVNGKHIFHGKGRSWSWAFSSPIRAFSKPYSSEKGSSSRSDRIVNLSAMPSLLSVGSSCR